MVVSMDIKELNDLLKERVLLCNFNLSEDEQTITFRLFSSQQEDGTIQLSKRNEEHETAYYVLSSFSKNANLYFIHPADITKFLEFEILERRKAFNASFEAYFRTYVKSFSPSFIVKNEKETVFTSIAVLKHKDNAWYKWFYGGNKFETIFVSGFYVDGVMLYCVSLYGSDKSTDCACCSTSFIGDLPNVLNDALQTLRDFEFKKKSS
jgi:hypothetical protein